MLFEGLLWPNHLLLWGLFVRNLRLGEKPRNTAVVQLVHYDGRDELRNSAIIYKSRGRAGSLLPTCDFSCLKQFLAN